MLPVKIASPEGLENIQDMESLGTVLGTQLRHTPAQSPLDYTLHENSYSKTLVHYLYTRCTHDSIGPLESVRGAVHILQLKPKVGHCPRLLSLWLRPSITLLCKPPPASDGGLGLFYQRIQPAVLTVRLRDALI